MLEVSGLAPGSGYIYVVVRWRHANADAEEELRDGGFNTA